MPEDFGAPKGHRTFQGVSRATRRGSSATAWPSWLQRTLAQARDAAEQVQVEYEELPVVIDLEDAAKEGAPRSGKTARKAMSGSG